MTGSSTQTSTSTILIISFGGLAPAEVVAGLEGAGHQVCQSSAPAAPATAETQGAELVILFAAGFGVSQLKLCQRLQQSRAIRTVPVMVICQTNHLAEKLQALELGVADYLTPPLWTEEILLRATGHITTYRRLRWLQHQTQRAITVGGSATLMTDLQRALRRQAELLQERNTHLNREVAEREQAQEALLREQEKSERLLLNILPQAIVDQLKQLHGSLAERFDDVTILFADIVNFTPLAAQTTPLDLVNWLNTIFSEFDRLTEQFQLEKIKTIGDAYMVVGGLPVPRADHADAVMQMALAMLEVTQRIQRQDGAPFELRIGINTGTVVAGVIGIKKFSYDLWGDAVNIASRMEAQGAPGKIQVTEATYRRLCHQYKFVKVGEILVKGHGPMTTYHHVES